MNYDQNLYSLNPYDCPYAALSIPFDSLCLNVYIQPAQKPKSSF